MWRNNLPRRYTGQSRWEYRLKDGRHGIVENAVPSGNYDEDERFARYLVRKKLGTKKLPKGTAVFPERSIS